MKEFRSVLVPLQSPCSSGAYRFVNCESLVMISEAHSVPVLPEPPGLGGKHLVLERKAQHHSGLVSYRGSGIGTNAPWDDRCATTLNYL